MITGLDHLVLTVHDVEVAARFYTRVLGMRVETFAGNRTALHFGNQKINLQIQGQETRNHACVGSGDICLITDWDMTRLQQHLLDEDVNIIEGPVVKSGAMGPISSVYLNDADGNLIEISSYDKEI